MLELERRMWQQVSEAYIAQVAAWEKKRAKFQVGKDPSQVVETVSIIYELSELSCLLSFTHIISYHFISYHIMSYHMALFSNVQFKIQLLESSCSWIENEIRFAKRVLPFLCVYRYAFI